MKLQMGSALVLAASLVASEECFLPLDVMFLQDTTGSYEDDLPNMLLNVPLIVGILTGRFPGTMFGVAEFRDKPYYPLGNSDDFCYKITEGNLSHSVTDVLNAYALLQASGGADLPEAQFQALINLVLDPTVGWRNLVPSGTIARRHETGAHVVILSTDAVPHLPGDMAWYEPPMFDGVPQNLPENSGVISTGDVDFECLHQDYPSDLQLLSAIKSTNATLIILTPDIPEVVRVWTWVNEELLGQSSQFYQTMESDSRDVFEAILNALDGFRIPTTCPASSTEAPTPFTGSQTTTAPVEASSLGVSDDTEETCDPHCNKGVIIRVGDMTGKLNVVLEN